MKKTQYTPQESLERIKLMMGYDMSKTLNENRQIILEQNDNTQDLKAIADSFWDYTGGAWGTGEEEMKQVIKRLRNKSEFEKFDQELINGHNMSFEQIINNEFESDNGKDVLEIVEILKGIGVNVDSGVKEQLVSSGSGATSSKKITFDKKFKILGGTNPVSGGSTITTTPPSTYDDVVNGKGVLKMGMKGPAVNQLQQMLVALGYNLGTSGSQKNGVDSSFGKLTDAAVRDFQSKNPPLENDGIVGKNTAPVILEKYTQSQTPKSDQSEPTYDPKLGSTGD